MRIINLEVFNFRNIEHAKYEFGMINEFLAKNGTGKSNLLDSIYFNLCGETNAYGSATEQDNLTKSIDKELKVILTIECGDRNRKHVLTRTIEKKFDEKNDKEKVFLKFKKTYQIDDDKFASSGKYYSQIRKYLGLEANDLNEVKFLMDSNFLNTIDYKVSRKYFVEQLELPTDIDLLADKKFDYLRDDLLDTFEDSGKTDILDVLSTQKKRLDNRQKRNSLLLDENKYILDNSKSKLITPEEDKVEKETLDRLNKTETEIVGESFHNKIYTDQEADLNKKLYSLSAKILADINLQKQEVNGSIAKGNEIRASINDVSINRTYTLNNIDAKKKSVQRNLEEATHYDFSISSLESKKYLSSSKCPSCGFELDGQAIENQKVEDKAQLDMLLSKKADLTKRVKDNDKCLKKEIKTLESKVADYDLQLVDLNKTIKDQADLYKPLAAELESLKLNLKNINESSEVLEIKQQIVDCNKAQAEAISKYRLDKQQRFTNIKAELATLNDTRKQRDTYIKALAEKKLLKKDHSSLINKQEELIEFKKLKLDSIQTTADILDIGLKLQYYTDGGTFKQCCVLVDNDIDYNGVNDGNKYLTGIRAIEGIKKHKELEDLPIVIDRMADLDSDSFKKITDMTNSQLFFSKVLNIDDKVKDFKKALEIAKVKDIDTKVADYRKTLEDNDEIELIVTERN